ncbi:hypothetical protein CAEBREN_20126 [Caenorhabditis brenneri]|uniref:Uncharacterized protein n=1 Tax=Caenorhabditis brenneri TaxID=135651 RepID=G0MYB0_CAEBE|nr:hypothetical protein CAEBREN_20126 [Caenorhabditis brenneri]
MPGTLSKYAKPRKQKYYIMYTYDDDEECGFETEDKSDKWGRWKKTTLQMTPELRENIMKHKELRGLLELVENGGGNEPVSLRSTAKNLVALRTTEPQMFPIESVLFCPNGTLEVEWKSFPESIFWDMPEIKESKEVQEIRTLKMIINEERSKIETLGNELDIALEKLQNLDIDAAPKRKRQAGVDEKTAAEEIEELRQKLKKDVGGILDRLRSGLQFDAAEKIANVEEAQPVPDAHQIPIVVLGPEGVIQNPADSIQGGLVIDHNNQDLPFDEEMLVDNQVEAEQNREEEKNEMNEAVIDVMNSILERIA